ncbi:MAG: hypothetical protein IJF92_00585 [Bacilli bacterium]|nr:hypothetical protein [Bacilli bacterium]MBQ3307689.1 hypothetical protein [Bacilli bacterium]
MNRLRRLLLKEDIGIDILNKLNERELLEMAYSKKRIEDILENICPKIREHLIKCYLWKDNNALNHWKTEIFSMLHQMYMLKNVNRLPTYNEIYRWFLETQFELIEDGTDNDVNTVKYLEKKEVPQYNKTNLINFQKSYFEWLLKELCSKGNVSIEEVFNKIDSLLN